MTWQTCYQNTSVYSKSKCSVSLAERAAIRVVASVLEHPAHQRKTVNATRTPDMLIAERTAQSLCKQHPRWMLSSHTVRFVRDAHLLSTLSFPSWICHQPCRDIAGPLIRPCDSLRACRSRMRPCCK